MSQAVSLPPMLRRPDTSTPASEHLKKLRELREKALGLVKDGLQPGTAAANSSGERGVQARSAVEETSKPLPSTPLQKWQTLLSASDAQPALAQLMHASVQAPVSAAKPRQADARDEPGATAGAALSSLRHMDQLQRLKQLQREGCRLVATIDI